jgi:hypothetical protein
MISRSIWLARFLTGQQKTGHAFFRDPLSIQPPSAVLASTTTTKASCAGT